MRVAVSGASGLIGSAVCARLSARGDEVHRLVRNRESGQSEIAWSPTEGSIGELDGFDAVIHLAGDGIADGRWTARKKLRIEESRTLGTRLVAETIARCSDKPRVLLSASGVGIYGDRGDASITERSGGGEGFLAEVCRKWEAATQPAADAGVRVIHLRFGVVLSPRGGALAKMLPPFKLGAGGPIGSGRQWMSWIALDDATAAMLWLLEQEAVAGPVNLVAPIPVTNGDFARALGHALSRPAIIPLPRFVVRTVFGQIADEALLASQRVQPTVLQACAFDYEQPDLERALATMIG